VAGRLGADTNNTLLVAGVNWKAQLLPIKIMDATGDGTDAMAAAGINYSVTRGARVSNNSWVGGGGATLSNAVANARNADQVFVAAAGNNNRNTDVTATYPASFPFDNILSVAALNLDGSRASFSNYGPTTVDLGAPGVNVLTLTAGGGVSAWSGTSFAAPHVAGVAALVRALHPGFTYLQTVNQIRNTIDPIVSMQGITTTGGRVNAGAAVGAGPEIRAFDGSTELIAATTNVNYGTAMQTQAVARTFTVKNVGGATLQLTSPPTVPAGFTLTTGLGSTTLAPGAMTTFTVSLNAINLGNFSGVISFNTNDADEDPFTFTVSGSVAQGRIIDDGDPGYSQVGRWTAYGGQGYQSDVHAAPTGTGTGVATWSFTGLTPGLFRVSATWTPYSNRATNAPYTIKDGSLAVGQVRVNQITAPGDFADAGVPWKDLGTFYISGSTLNVELSDNANYYVIADAIRIQRLGGLPATREIEVFDGPNGVANGSTAAFGDTPVGLPVTHTFIVRNVGSTNLTLSTSPTFAGSGFTIVSPFPAGTTLATGATATFQVRLDAASAGAFSGTVSFTNNDDDNGDGVESPFSIAVTGSATTKYIIDDGDPGYTNTGPWLSATGQGFLNDVHYIAAGNGAAVAAWTFTGLTPGKYRISATWSPLSNRATNTPFRIKDGSLQLIRLTVNQQLAPSGGPVEGGTTFQDLGGPYYITGNSVTVEMSNDANAYVIADAIRIERIAPLPATREIEVFESGTGVADGGSIPYGTTQQTVPVTKTYTVRNVGMLPLSLNTIPSVPAGFALTSSYSPGISLATGATVNFQVQLTAATIGPFSGMVSFNNNDDDNGDGIENPFNFTVSGAVTPFKQIIDDGDPGFSTIGNWNYYTGQGFGTPSDVLAAAAGTGADSATWSFIGLAAGSYRVSVTWTRHPNRATNAKYSVTTTGTSQFTINQQLAPAGGPVESGTTFQDLGTFVVNGGSIVVSLNNNANGYVIADAVRIEKL
jgi:subtilisin family serine protease